MTINKRSILGARNPYDDGVKANYVNGDAPASSPDDQASSMIGSHGDLTSAFKQAQARHSVAPSGDGSLSSYGVGLGAGDSSFSTMDGDGGPGDHDSQTPSDTSGEGMGIAGSLPMVSRADGGQSGIDGTGMAI